MKFLLTLALAGMTYNATAFAQNENEIYTKTYLSYEVDGLDIWELPANSTRADIANSIQKFEARCKNDVPQFYYNRVASLDLSPADFKISTEKYAYRIRSYGDSHRCRIHAEVKKQSAVNFKTVNSQSFVDTNNVTAFDQCKLFRDELDRKKDELKLFDRIIKLVWNQRNGQAYIESCYVTYTTIVTAAD